MVCVCTSLTRLLFRKQEEMETRLGMAVVGDDTQLVLVEYLGLIAAMTKKRKTITCLHLLPVVCFLHLGVVLRSIRCTVVGGR